MKVFSKWLYLALRFVTLAIRFLFIALFFRYSEAEYGAYALVATAVTLGVYVLGLDFYNYANRELLKADGKISHVFFHQFLFYLPVYALFLPFFYLFFYFGFLDGRYLFWFYAVLIAEHLSFELHRILFVLKRPLAANVNLFFRNGAWMLLAMAHLWWKGGIDLRSLLIYWLIGDVLSFAAAGKAWQSVFQSRQTFFSSVDWSWIGKGLRVSFPFFLATVSYKIIEFSDRYMIDWYWDKKQVGVYAFFSGMSVLVNTIVYTAVISLLFPTLLELLMRGDERFLPDFKRFRKKIIVWTLGSAVLVLAGMPVVLIILGKDEHLHAYSVFVVLTLANVFLNFSLIWHYVLYGFHVDRKIFIITFLAAVINVGLNVVLIPAYGIMGAALSTLVAFLTIWLLKRTSARNYLKRFRTQAK